MTLKELRADYESGRLGKQEFIRGASEQLHSLFDFADYLEGTEIERLVVTRGGVVAEFSGSPLKMWCPRGDARHVAFESMNFRRYEGAEMEMILKLFRGGVFFDVGANAGYYSLRVAERCPMAAIHAFEPIPATSAMLRANLELNRISNVTSHGFGLSEQSGELTFYHDPKVSVATTSAGAAEGDCVEKVSCRVEQLDEFCRREGIAPDFIKCDVEGAEFSVFRGAVETIRAAQPAIFSEMLRKWAARFHYHPNDMIEFFDELGYECFVASGARLSRVPRVTNETSETNFFFLHSGRHERIIDELT